MQIPWLTRPPTAEEVAAHARAYPRARRSCGTWIRRVGSDMPFFVVLASDGEVLYWDGIKWDGTDSKDARWLPCTAEGIPVCLLPKCVDCGGDVEEARYVYAYPTCYRCLPPPPPSPPLVAPPREAG